jgi:hypothetical protein
VVSAGALRRRGAYGPQIRFSMALASGRRPRKSGWLSMSRVSILTELLRVVGELRAAGFRGVWKVRTPLLIGFSSIRNPSSRRIGRIGGDLEFWHEGGTGL